MKNKWNIDQQSIKHQRAFDQHSTKKQSRINQNRPNIDLGRFWPPKCVYGRMLGDSWSGLEASWRLRWATSALTPSPPAAVTRTGITIKMSLQRATDTADFIGALWDLYQLAKRGYEGWHFLHCCCLVYVAKTFRDATKLSRADHAIPHARNQYCHASWPDLFGEVISA